MYGLELILIIFATLAQALSSDSPSMSIVGTIIFWRVLMGIGIGGDYPLSSIITSELVDIQVTCSLYQWLILE
jgi:MFS transporter, PHS family, inorganic phosphate transporter